MIPADVSLKEQASSAYSLDLYDKYAKYTDFRELVDKLIGTERGNRGHCGAVIDAAKLAYLITYNPYAKKHLHR